MWRDLWAYKLLMVIVCISLPGKCSLELWRLSPWRRCPRRLSSLCSTLARTFRDWPSEAETATALHCLCSGWWSFPTRLRCSTSSRLEKKKTSLQIYHINLRLWKSELKVLLWLTLNQLFMREHRGGELEPDKVGHCIGTFGRAFEELAYIHKIAQQRYHPINSFQALLRTLWFVTVMPLSQQFSRSSTPSCLFSKK